MPCVLSPLYNFQMHNHTEFHSTFLKDGWNIILQMWKFRLRVNNLSKTSDFLVTEQDQILGLLTSGPMHLGMELDVSCMYPEECIHVGVKEVLNKRSEWLFLAVFFLFYLK